MRFDGVLASAKKTITVFVGVAVDIGYFVVMSLRLFHLFYGVQGIAWNHLGVTGRRLQLSLAVGMRL